MQFIVITLYDGRRKLFRMKEIKFNLLGKLKRPNWKFHACQSRENGHLIFLNFHINCSDSNHKPSELNKRMAT